MRNNLDKTQSEKYNMFQVSITALSQVIVFCNLTTVVTQTLKSFLPDGNKS